MPSAITSVLLPATSYLLTDLPTVKDELQLDVSDTSMDTFLKRTLAEISADISLYCNRVFPIETVQDVFYPEFNDSWSMQRDQTVTQVTRWPIVTAAVTLTTSGTVTEGSALPFASTAGVAIGMPAATVGLPGGVFVQAMDDVSVTLSEPLLAPIPAGAAVWFGPSMMLGTTPLDPARQFVVNSAVGQVRRTSFCQFGWGYAPTSITYQAGYATIPDDLVGVALRLIAGRKAARGRDPMLRSKDQPGLGTSTYWVGSIPGVRGAFPEDIADRLSRYRVPVVA